MLDKIFLVNINDFEFLGIPVNLLSNNFSLLFLKNKCINTLKASMHITKKMYIKALYFLNFGLCQSIYQASVYVR